MEKIDTESVDIIQKSSKFVNKLRSRKFQVWIIWLILTIYAVINPTMLPLDSIIQYFGLVSLVYVGSNVFQQYIHKDK